MEELTAEGVAEHFQHANEIVREQERGMPFVGLQLLLVGRMRYQQPVLPHQSGCASLAGEEDLEELKGLISGGRGEGRTIRRQKRTRRLRAKYAVIREERAQKRAMVKVQIPVSQLIVLTSPHRGPKEQTRRAWLNKTIVWVHRIMVILKNPM